MAETSDINPTLNKHTPGPWALDQALGDAIKRWLADDAPIGARENIHSGHIFWLMQHIKAIPQVGAAPDMLMVLKDCLPLFEHVACGEVEDRVRAAIAKASA